MKKLFTACLFLLTTITANAQYCIPSPGTDGCADGDVINDFVLLGENGTSIVNLASGCSVNAYADFTAQSVSLGQGTGYTATISTQFFPDDNVAIWIDFDDDDVFDFSDMVGTFTNVSVIGSPVVINIPAGAPLGPHRMRVSLRFDVPAIDIDPCNIGINASDFGEAHDYTVNIVPTPTCLPVTNLTVSGITQTGATLNWNGTAPQYSIEYGPTGFIPGTGTYTTSMTASAILGGLSGSANYTAYVRALCSGSDSSSAVSISFATSCGNVTPPYTENFDGVTIPDIPVCMTVEDANFDANTWMTQDFLSSSFPNGLIYGSDLTQNADEWLFTPGLNVVAGNTYTVSFAYATEGSAPESLEVRSGTAASSTSMGVTPHYTNTTLMNTAFQTASFTYTAATTGVVYFGWHLFSDANSFGLVLDDISVTPGTVTACDTSLTLTASAVTFSSATLDWSAVTGASGYEYVLDQTAAVPVGAGTATNLLTFPAAGLTPNTTYFFHVRTVCNTGFSAWKTVSFTTAPVSVTDVDGSNAGVVVYPNPVTDIALIEVTDPGKNAQLQVTDISGRVLQQADVTQKKNEIDMSKLSPGIYIIRYNDDKNSQLIKVVKQ